MRYDYGYFEGDRLGKMGDFRLWRRIIGYTRPYSQGVAGAVLLSLVITGASLTLPYLVSIGVDRYITKGSLDLAARLSGLVDLALPFAGLVFLDFLANFFQVTILEWTGQHVMHRMRQDLFVHLMGLELAFFNRYPIGRLVTRLTNDIQNMHEMFTSVIVTLFNDMIRLVGIMIMLFLMNWRLALVLFFIVPVMFLVTLWFSKMARDAFRAIRSELARINGFLQESLAGMAVIQLFLREEDTRARFAAINQTYYEKTLFQINVFGIFVPLIEVLSALGTGIIISYGGWEIMEQQMTIGVLVAFLSYMRLFFQPLRELSQKYSIVQSAMASAERIFQLLDTPAGLRIAEVPKLPVSTLEGKIEFSDITFGYEADQPVLHDFSLRVRPGETIAIVGATGSGKTTIISLLERFYDPDQGVIRFDGVDLRELDPQWLRTQIGLVMQEVFLVPASVRENILLDQEMDDEALQRIIADSQLMELIGQLPLGLATRIGEGGIELSAGQRQLLAFARVLARDPRVLILDEASANIDSETEVLIERAIEVTLARRTSIVIAHRLSTIRRADRIIVMDQGRIVEQGTHDALMAARGVYHHLQTLQNGNGLSRTARQAVA